MLNTGSHEDSNIDCGGLDVKLRVMNPLLHDINYKLVDPPKSDSVVSELSKQGITLQSLFFGHQGYTCPNEVIFVVVAKKVDRKGLLSNLFCSESVDLFPKSLCFNTLASYAIL